MEYSEDWDLSTIPDQALWSEVGKRRAKGTGGIRVKAGRKVKPTRCTRCGEIVTATEARRGHGCKIAMAD